MKNMSSGTCQIIIAGLCVVIECLQLRLSKQINRQNISKEKGYFIIEETNLRKKEAEDYKRCIGLFDLNRELRFHLYGNGDIFLLKEQIVINGIIVESKEPIETFFSIYAQDCPYGILLSLSGLDKEKPELDVEITLKLRNIIGNVYTEKILLEFQKRDIANEWFLHRKNTSFQFK